MPVEGSPMNKTLSLLVTRFAATSAVKRRLVVLGAMVLAAVLLGRWTHPLMNRPGSAEAIPEYQAVTDEPMLEANRRIDVDKLKEFADAQLQANEPRSAAAGGAAAGPPYGLPLVAHSAELAIATKEFSKSRTSLEEVLEHHRGYAAKLRMAGRRTGSVLSATLRVPSSELGATVSDLKSLGEVEQEAQSADEVTEQHADLEARLANAQATLRRLKELLEKQTYPDGNVRELQRQIASASAEVNRLEAERRASEHRVTFANVQFSMREVLAQPEESLGAQLHAAATAGFGEAAASISALLLFFIGRGPVVLLWVAILYIPARLVWRRLRLTPVAQTAPAVNG
jgi:hypothetical protein